MREKVELVEISIDQQPLMKDDFILMIRDGMPSVEAILLPQWN